MTFSPSFLWGVASAGHQNEGDNRTSDTWFAEHVEPTVFTEPSGPACHGWQRWREDVDLAAGMGLNAYRFSVEWSRVEPTSGQFDVTALEHYSDIVDHCIASGLSPVVTLNHFTSPHWFAAAGGWLHPEGSARFARYCEQVAVALGDRVAAFVTLNEPNLAHLLTWVHLPPVVRDLERATLEAASKAAGVPRYRLSNVILPEEMDAIGDGMTNGHRAARAVLKAQCPAVPVGLSIALVDDQVSGPDASLRDRKRAEVYRRWLELASEDDFVGVQNYERLYYDAEGPVDAAGAPFLGGIMSGHAPGSLGAAVRYAHAQTGVPVLVTEHGMMTDDDAERIAFLAPSLDGLRAAVDDGVPVVGYMHWTLMDNFEWIFGYGPKMGLHAVDRDTFERTPKPSATAYASLVAHARSTARS